MAQGTFLLFDKFVEDMTSGVAVHDMGADVIKLGIISEVTAPLQTEANPRWQATGASKDFSAVETSGGSVPVGGPTLASVTYGMNGGRREFDADDVILATNGANPANARWGILYNDSATNKECIGFVDLTTDGGTTAIDMTTGQFTLSWDATGVFTIGTV